MYDINDIGIPGLEFEDDEMLIQGYELEQEQGLRTTDYREDFTQKSRRYWN